MTLRVTKFDPFEIFLSILFGLAGGLQLVYGAPPAATSAAVIDPTSLKVWLVLITAGCVTTLLGVAARRVWGYLAEQVGLAASGVALLAYGVQVTLIQVERGLLSPVTLTGGPLLALLGVSFLWKMNQVKRNLAALQSDKWSDKT